MLWIMRSGKGQATRRTNTEEGEVAAGTAPDTATVARGHSAPDLTTVSSGLHGSEPAADGSAPGSQVAGDVQASSCEVDRHVFERILLTPEMVTDHLPDAYLAVLQQL